MRNSFTLYESKIFGVGIKIQLRFNKVVCRMVAVIELQIFALFTGEVGKGGIIAAFCRKPTVLSPR
jgi:hypothetical protein